MNRISLVLISICLLVFSCKNKEKASRKPLEGKKAAYLLNQLDVNEFHFDTFSTKSDFTLIQDGKKTKFKATIRLKKDSVLWMSITPALGIELARVLITQDSVKLINRLEKNYFIGDFEYINKKFNVDLRFDDIQAVMLGNSIAFEKDEKLKFAIDNEMYYLGNMAKRKANKVDDKPEKVERKKNEVVSLWLDEETFKINKFLLSDLTADRFILGAYNNHEVIEDQLLPRDLMFDIQSDKPAKINVHFYKVSMNKPLSYSFKISSKYERVYF